MSVADKPFYAPIPQSTRRWWDRYLPGPSRNPSERTLKRLIWLYWVLWFFEGIMRKWIFPQYAGPLLVIRDPVALVIISYAAAKGIWHVNSWIAILWTVGVLAFGITLAQQVPLGVALVGLRTLCLHFPLIFILPRVLSREDVDRMGNLVLDLAFPMALLMVLQFSAASSAFVNAGAGLDASQIGGVDNKIRAPGIFSYITGVNQYYSLVAAFMLGRFAALDRGRVAFLLLPAMGLMLASSVAISRTLTLSIVLVIIAFLILSVRVGIPARKLAWLFITCLCLSAIVMESSVVRSGQEAFTKRWTMAEDNEGSTLNRGFGDFWLTADTLQNAGLAGHGIGLGTNMGATLLGEEGSFLLAEREWERVVLEMGVILGVGFIFWRGALLIKLAGNAAAAWSRRDMLPGLLLAAGGIPLLSGTSGQPSTLGYIVLAGGLTLTAAKSHYVFVVQRGVLQRMPRREAKLATRRRDVLEH